MHDVAVIGVGMMGAAALRYLAEAGVDVVGVGPAEPADRTAHTGVFASHYDEGRITRVLDPEPVWGELGARAIAAYADIEARSGVRFHYPAGCLRVSDDTSDPGCTLNAVEAWGCAHDVAFDALDAGALRERFPFLRFGDAARGLDERGAAGYINPRALVRAQLTLATAAGAPLVRAEVQEVARDGDVFVVSGPAFDDIRARRVLIATGAWGNELLPRPVELSPRAVGVVLAEVDETEAVRLAAMPSIIYRFPGDPALVSIYALPPIRYPDGKTYVKIGGTLREPIGLRGRDELNAWFHGDGNPVENAATEAVLRRMIPGLAAHGIRTVACTVTYTGHNRPYVDEVAPGMFVALGGCGAAAKSSDAIGRLAADLLRGVADPLHDACAAVVR